MSYFLKWMHLAKIGNNGDNQPKCASNVLHFYHDEKHQGSIITKADQNIIHIIHTVNASGAPSPT